MATVDGGAPEPRQRLGRGEVGGPPLRFAPGEGLTTLLKRDGREVPFERERIAEAVRRAMDAVDEDDPPLAQEVADVVVLTAASHLEQSAALGARAPLGVEDVQDLVEQVLIEFGRARVAKAYILYRDRRSRARQALTLTQRPDRSGRMPLVRDGGGTSPWSQQRIVAALMEEADLPREIAEEVAERVQERVFGAGLARLSTSLVRELVDNELMAMGQESALLRQEPVGIPRHDLRRMLARPRAQRTICAREVGSRPWGALDEGFEGDVATALLTRFTLADVLDERTAELHKGGAIWIERIDRPHMVLSRAVPTDLCLRREPSAQSCVELLAELAPMLEGVTHGLVLEGLHRVAAPLLRAARGPQRLRDHLVALGGLALAAGRSLDLCAPGGRPGSLVAHLLHALDELVSGELPVPRLFLGWDELAPAIDDSAELSQAAQRLLAAGVLVPVWHSRSERWVAPGCRRRSREMGALCCAGAVAVNLPRLARQAGPWREDLLFEAMTARVRDGLDALEALDAFQRDHPAARPQGLRERRGFALVPVGLDEALKILGDGVARPEQGARLLGVLGDALRRLSDQRGISVSLSPFFAERACRHMARLDVAHRRESQPRLFADLPAPEQELDRPYSVGYKVPGVTCAALGGGRPAGRDSRSGLDQADLCATLQGGALYPAHRSGSSGGDDSPRLDAWRRFHQRREEFLAPSSLETRPAHGAGSLFHSGRE